MSNTTLQEIEVQCMSCVNATITLTFVGGQYQVTYQGRCKNCGAYVILQGEDDDHSGVPHYCDTEEAELIKATQT